MYTHVLLPVQTVYILKVSNIGHNYEQCQNIKSHLIENRIS